MFSLVAVSAELAEQLVAVESGGEDAVHQARTRVRRLRSILGVYKRAFDVEQNDRMRARLKALGDRLGEVRDLEVRAAALEDLLEVDDAPETIEAVEALAAEHRSAHASALASLVRHLDTRGHRRLLADLQFYAAEPPLRGRGRKHPRRIIRRGLRSATKRVLADGDDSLEALHATRKAARRLRYAAEAVADDLGRKAVRLAAEAEAIHDALGDHRDATLLARLLRENGLPGPAVRAEHAAAAALEPLDALLDALRD
ncbi:CHAD domain-containing protein [uncultured Leifsonia sp.]|uniref:CHAD domain-containing protein n=1 Tax=uncultured Leifsonia sp. TaxID=340359 RepID=UPI0028D04CC2|nr:CHAD domain-containing protein [uncultured Leifsonia sp.]